jgi:predicted DNA-binding transcriptional regulator YafY
VRRAGRLMKLLELLHEKPGLEAGELAAACSVSGRTFQRDLEALNRAGFAVYFDRGYRLAAPALVPPVTFAVNEALALRLAAETGSSRADGATAQALRLAAEKLGQALAARPPEESSSAQLSLGLPIKDARVEELLSLLARAIAERRTVRVKLRGRPGQDSATRRVDPYRLVRTDDGWELLAYHHERERMIQVPLARLASVSVLQRRFQPLPVRILERHLHAYQTAAPGVQWIRLICRPPLAQTFKACPPVGTVKWEESPDGSATLTLAAIRAEDLVPWLLAWSDAVEVLEPPRLRQEIQRIARALVERYARQTAGRDSGAPLATSPPVSLS